MSKDQDTENLKRQVYDVLKYLAEDMKKNGCSIKEISKELSLTQKTIREMLKEK
jgi:DNA-binding MarR family transcriptional regulator